MDGVSALVATVKWESQTNHCPSSIPEPRQAQNQNQNQNLRRLANKGTNDDNFLNDSSTNRRSMFEARARSTTGACGSYNTLVQSG